MMLLCTLTYNGYAKTACNDRKYLVTKSSKHTHTHLHTKNVTTKTNPTNAIFTDTSLSSQSEGQTNVTSNHQITINLSVHTLLLLKVMGREG